MAIGELIEQMSQHRIVIKSDIFISNFNIKESGKTTDGIFILNLQTLQLQWGSGVHFINTKRRLFKRQIMALNF